MAFSLSRNARLFVSTSATIAGMSDVNTWQIPVLDGFSFTQATTTQEVTVTEAGATPVRGQQVFNTALEPVNWSFANYMRPRFATTADAVERIMWEALAGPNAGNTITSVASGSATTRGAAGGNGMGVNFASSNVNELLQLSLVFDLGAGATGGAWYHLTGCLVDTAEIDFSLDAIASITWSGFGDAIVQLTGADLTTVQGWAGTDLDALPGAGQFVNAPTDNACIRNKLTSITLDDLESGEPTYTIAITGGSVTISNNVTFLTPESLGVLNLPCAGFTGARTVNGNITAYLRDGTNETADLLGKLAGDTLQATPQNFDFDMYIGFSGGAAPTSPWNEPAIQLAMDHTHLVIPTINIEDVVSVDIGFSALPYDESVGTFDLESTNELVVTYYPDET
jgi:hypothetical protein